MSWRFHAVFGVLASALVIFAIAWGFMLVGSPGQRRAERLDEQRLQDLQTIAREISDLAVEGTEPRMLKAPLPKTLEEAAERARNQLLHLQDPETGAPYGYSVKDESTFELRADFTRARHADYSVFWNHPPGQHSFTINVLDPPPLY
ncbi:MAG: hypothetical protein AB7O59_24060 [Pirellulales bacterium]